MANSMIQVANLSKTYTGKAGEFTALRRVELEIAGGEMVAVIGPSGSGKSTLLNLLSGIDRPTTGEITVAGQSINGLSEAGLSLWRGRNIGMVFQFFQLLPTLTILENILLPMDFCRIVPGREREKRARRLLGQVGLAGEAGKFPAELSGGEQQRAAIARALANDPGIVMADEPTGNLDSKTTETVFRLFQELVVGGKTLIMVTHNQELAERAGRIIRLDDGAVSRDYRTGAGRPEVRKEA